MGRTAQYRESDVFAWIGRALVNEPSVTVQEISRGTGVSVGSLYHRFGSLENLLAETWLWAREQAQPGLVEPLDGGRQAHAMRSALNQVRLAIESPDAAVILHCVARPSLVRPGMKAELLARVAAFDRALDAALEGFVARSGFGAEAVQLALLDLPGNIVRLYLPRESVPADAVPFAKRAFRAVMALGRPETDPGKGGADEG